jgi:hypothetical protein
MQQPGLLRTEHRTGSATATQHTRHTMRLQGGVFASPARTLFEDLAYNGRRMLARVLPDPHAGTPGFKSVTTRSGELPHSLPVMPAEAPAPECSASCGMQPAAQP